MNAKPRLILFGALGFPFFTAFPVSAASTNAAPTAPAPTAPASAAVTTAPVSSASASTNAAPAASSSDDADSLLPASKAAATSASADSSDDLLPGSAASSTSTNSSDSDDLLVPGAAAAKASGAPAAASGDSLLLPQANSPGGGNESLLIPGAVTPQSTGPTAATAPAASEETAAEAHERLLVENKFPSASTCAQCHPTQFRQWSVSQHAYSQMSPVFNTMQAAIDSRTSGTNGDFCIRCHTQVGMQLKEPIFGSNLDRHATSREGITCIVCHRVEKNYGKVSGRTSIAQGDIFAPVYGPTGDKNLKIVLADPDKYPVVSKPGEVGRAIHASIVKFDPLAKPVFCGTCHDVNLLNGFRLEEAFSQYKNSPADKHGVTCQDCHMGKIPGIKSGYAFGPAAMIGDQPTPPRKLTNHMFAGPDYSIIHPGMFPHNTQAQALATLREWLQFNYKAGWGTDAFENNVPKGYVFPTRWQSIDDRYQARSILDDQFALLEEANTARYQILRRAYQFGDFQLVRNDRHGIKFRVNVLNATDGHAVPTGFDAERANFLQVTVRDRTGKLIFVSGDRDPNGDVRDDESAYVKNYELPYDSQLFSLQSKFLVTLIRGGERLQVLPTNKSIDPLPYVRPSTNADVLIAAPFGARKQSIGIPPNGHRWAPYDVSGHLLTGKGPYRVNIKFITQMIPVNLVADISGMGFDYNMSPRAVAQRIVDRSEIIWDKTIVLPDHPEVLNLRPTEAEIMAPPTKPFIPGIKIKPKPPAAAAAKPALPDGTKPSDT